jgi:hypothetical protein
MFPHGLEPDKPQQIGPFNPADLESDGVTFSVDRFFQRLREKHRYALKWPVQGYQQKGEKT